MADFYLLAQKLRLEFQEGLLGSNSIFKVIKGLRLPTREGWRSLTWLNRITVSQCYRAPAQKNWENQNFKTTCRRFSDWIPPKIFTCFDIFLPFYIVDCCTTLKFVLNNCTLIWLWIKKTLLWMFLMPKFDFVHFLIHIETAGARIWICTTVCTYFADFWISQSDFTLQKWF